MQLSRFTQEPQLAPAPVLLRIALTLFAPVATAAPTSTSVTA
jgi:hypothetical protein